MKASRIIGIALFFVLSVLPGLKTALNPAGSKLGGSESNLTFVQPSLKSFWNEELQPSFEKWWSRAVGFRGQAIRSDNQLSLWLFGELGSQNRKRVAIGQDNYLFERGYITAYQRSVDPAPIDRIKALVGKIKQTETILRNSGKGFVLVISPSKASMLADKLPPSAKITGEPLQEYKAFTAELSAAGVTFFDAPKWLSENQSRLGGPVFYRSGAHWSQDACCRMYEQVGPMLEAQIGKPLRKIRCDPVQTRKRPYGQDGDLLRLSNIWMTSNFVEPYVFPKSPADPDKGRLAPKVIAVGSSFMWDPLTMLRRFHLVSNRSRIFYYFKTRAIDPNHRLGAIKADATDWRDDISTSDAVIVEINESALLAAGFGFFDAMTGEVVGTELPQQSLDDINDG